MGARGSSVTRLNLFSKVYVSVRKAEQFPRELLHLVFSHIDPKSAFYYIWATLRIDIAQKLTESEDLRVVWSHADAPEIFDELHLKGDLVAQVLVSPEGESKCLVTGSISGVQTLTCSRSLEPFDHPFSTEIVVEVERTQVAKQELDDDDVDVYAYKIPQGQLFVDVSECVRELIILQEPLAPVKNPEEDFIFVTNNEPEDEVDDKPTDPRWEKLKALKSKMENRS